jgi:undecaprenyl-diphosphatase
MELIIKATIMGVVEGITEFVPMSSTGYLIIAGELINFQGK